MSVYFDRYLGLEFHEWCVTINLLLGAMSRYGTIIVLVRKNKF